MFHYAKAVDLAKRFCDGSAPRVVNGCLRTFVKDIEVSGVAEPVLSKKKSVSVGV